MAIKVGINGFGRIGRCIIRAAIQNPDIEFVAINDIADTPTMAHLLKYDSVHGTFAADVEVQGEAMLVQGKKIQLLSERDPANLPWRELGVEVVLECTGLFRNRAGAAKHIEAGARKVIISAPAKDEDLTVVMGVNHQSYDPSEHHIISNASCTTNCLAPAAKVLLDRFGIEYGVMTTVHSYTNDQRILDLPHKDLRRARAAALSMIPTTTGAAKAVGLVLPELQGKLDGMSIRVPTPNVSVVDLVVLLGRAVTLEEIQNAFKQAAEGELKGIMRYINEPLVSSDFNGDPHSSIIDGLATMLIGERMAKIITWYDNEWGFANRMVDLTKFVAAGG